MRRIIHFHLALGAFAWLAFLSLPHTSAQENVQGYNAFRTVRTRNIFDPQRRAMRTETASAQAAGPAQNRPNFFALTGAMVADDRMLAFFSGSRSEYNKVLRPGETIADFKIAQVTATGVELVREGKTVALNVGQQIALDGPAAGVPSAISSEFNAAPSSGAVTTSSGTSSPAAAAPSGIGGGDKSEILKRMMERREKEGSK
jgi:hypothetical protein